MNGTEAQRLASMAHALRPDWPYASVLTKLADFRTYAYRDVAVALAWIACDPATQTPARLHEAGPWWKATQATATPHPVTRMCPDHPDHPALRCPLCPQEVDRVDHDAGMAAVRAALQKGPS